MVLPLSSIGLGTPTLTGSLSATLGSGGLSTLNGSLTAANLPALTFGGFSATVDSIVLSTDRTVTVNNLRISVPLPGQPLTFVGNIVLSGDGKGGVVGSPQLEIDNSTLAYAGFSMAVKKFVISSTGVIADGVSLTIPLGVGGKTFTLTGALSIQKVNGVTKVVGYIDLPNVEVSAYGYTLTVDDIRLGNEGLDVGKATLDLGPLFQRAGLNSLAVTGLKISPSFKVSGGIISINGSSTFSIDIGGASLTISSLSIGSTGLNVGSVTATLPPVFGSKSLTLSNLAISPEGEVSGSITMGLTFSLGDFAVAAKEIDFDSKKGVAVRQLTVTLPIIQGPISLGDITYDGSKLTIADLPLPTDFHIPNLTTGAPMAADQQKADCKAGGGTYLPLPPINAGGFSISGAGCLSFGKDSAGHSTYLIVGQGAVALSGVGTLAAAFELGSPYYPFPYVFHHAVINVQFVQGLPIDETGLEINGIIGGIGITEDSSGKQIYSLEVGADFQTDDGGYLLNGNLRLNFATDGNFGIGGQAQLLRFFNVAGGFCVRIVNDFDYVCQGSLPDQTFANQAAHGTGLYAEVNGGISVHIYETASFSFDVRAHIWTDSYGPELAASANVALHIPTSFVSPGLPPCGADATADAQIGRFNPGRVAGVKADLDVHICPVDITWGICSISCSHTHTDIHFGFNIFIDSQGNLHTSNSGYSLIEGRNGNAYALARNGSGVNTFARIGPELTSHLAGVPSLPNLSGAPLDSALNAVARGSLRGSLSSKPRSHLSSPTAKTTPAPATRTYTNDASVTIQPGQTSALFSLVWKQGDPKLTLVDPNGVVYDPTHVGAGYTKGETRAFVPYQIRSGLPDGDTAATAIYVPSPAAGVWHIVVANVTGNEGYVAQLHAVTPAPTMTVDAPTAGQTLAAAPAATLGGTVSGADPTAASTVSLYYTQGKTITAGGKTLPNYSGTLIASNVPVVNGRWSYTWNAGTLPAGVYEVYATLDNGLGAMVNAYAAGHVQVVQPAHPDGPTNVTATDANDQLTVMWSPLVQSRIVHGYRLRWRTSTMRAGAYYTLDAGESQSLIVNEAERGVTYSAEVATYDISGNLSPYVPATKAAAAPATAADFTFVAGRGTTVASGVTNIPLTIKAIAGAKAAHGPTDFVSLSLAGAPAGILSRLTVSTANLFDTRSTPQIRVYAGASLRPGTYTLTVIARQSGSGRTRTARAVLVVLPGQASTVALTAGTPHTRADGMVERTLTARVTDLAGGAVANGATTLAFTSVGATFAPARGTVKNGLVTTTVVYPAGTTPVVTGDAGTALGSLYLGPTPAGAFRMRYFAATTGQGAQKATKGRAAVGAANESLVLRNPLSSNASARLSLLIKRSGAKVQTQALYVPVPANGTTVENLVTLAPRETLVGVSLTSDLPLVVTHRIVRALAHGKSRTLQTSRGVAAPGKTARLTLAPGLGAVTVYNPGGKTATVRLTLSGKTKNGHTVSASARVLAAAGSLLQVQTYDLTATLRREARTPLHGSLTITVQATRPVVAETALARVSSSPVRAPAPAGTKSV